MAKHVCTLGIDIGASAIKMVEAQVGSNGVVNAMQAIRTELPDPVMAGEILAGIMASYKFRARRATTSISGRGVIVRPVGLPDLEPSALRAAARSEAEKFVPYDISEAMVDCQRLSGGGDGRVRALVVVARTQTIEDHLIPFAAAHLAPAAVDIDGLALGNALLAAGEAEEGKATAIVDLGYSKAVVTVVSGADVFTKEIYKSGAAMDEALAAYLHIGIPEAARMKQYPGERLGEVKEALLPVLEELAGEIRQVFDQFTKLFGAPVSRMVVSGGVAKFPGVVELFGRMLEIPSAPFNPFAATAGGAAAQASGVEGDYAVAFGLAVRP